MLTEEITVRNRTRRTEKRDCSEDSMHESLPFNEQEGILWKAEQDKPLDFSAFFQYLQKKKAKSNDGNY